MNLFKKRSIFGFIIAPLVGLFTVVLTLILESKINSLLKIDTYKDPSLETLVGMAVTIGIPGMYFLACLFGWPTIRILRKLNLRKWTFYLYSGIAWGSILSLLILVFIIKDAPFMVAVYFSLIFQITGVLSFLCYWFISIKEPNE